MARGELLSILGLYQYDDSIFDELVLPSEINKEVLVNNIILDCAEFEILYPNPNIMKEAIGFWSKSRLKAWEDMKNVLIVENYRPFINLERRESGYDLETRALKTQGTDSLNSSTIGTSDSTTNSSGTNETTSSNTQDLDSTTTNKVSAFNSSNFENKEQSIVDSTTSNSGSESQESSQEITNETNDSITTTSSNNSNVDNTGTIRNDYEHIFEGDSAMFTKQNIIEQEIEMRLKYDLYKIIIEEFKMKFCLLIY